MNEAQTQGKLNQLKGRIEEFLGRLLHDELEMIGGRHQQYVGMLQARYGLTEWEAQQKAAEKLTSTLLHL